MTLSVESHLPSCPMERSSPFEPPPGYARARSEAPITKVRLVDGSTGWFVTGHALVRRLLNDPKVSKNGLRPGYPPLVPDQEALVRGQKGFLVWMDPPDHTMYRRMLAGEFSVNTLERLRPHVEHIVNECIDQLLDAGPPADLVQVLSLPVPTMTICELLGVPYTDRQLFQESTAATVNLRTTQEERNRTVAELRQCATRAGDRLPHALPAAPGPARRAADALGADRLRAGRGRTGEDGLVVLLTEDPPEERRQEVIDAAGSCPAQAILVDGE